MQLVLTDCSFSDPSLVGQKMPATTAAPGDGDPGSVDPALVKMSNQARSEAPASTKLNEQDNTHAAPVCALMPSRSPLMPRRARPRRAPRIMLGSYTVEGSQNSEFIVSETKQAKRLRIALLATPRCRRLQGNCAANLALLT